LNALLISPPSTIDLLCIVVVVVAAYIESISRFIVIIIGSTTINILSIDELFIVLLLFLRIVGVARQALLIALAVIVVAFTLPFFDDTQLADQITGVIFIGGGLLLDLIN
jgi:hypothetical protein